MTSFSYLDDWSFYYIHVYSNAAKKTKIRNCCVYVREASDCL